MRQLPGAAVLAVVYCLALGSFAPTDAAAGLLVGWVALRGLGLATVSISAGELVRRVVAFPVFALAVAREILSGTVQVAAIVLGLRSPLRAGIVSIPLEERTRTGVAVAALTLTLSPGEVLVRIDWDSRRMLIHVIDATDPDALRARHRHFYERFQRRVFP